MGEMLRGEHLYNNLFRKGQRRIGSSVCWAYSMLLSPISRSESAVPIHPAGCLVGCFEEV